MNIIVVGSGRWGATLAYSLYKKGHTITVIDRFGASFQNLPSDFNGITIEDDVLAQDVLVRAGIEEADAVAAVTDSDAINAVVGQIAQHHFHVRNVVVRTYNPRWEPLHLALGLKEINSIEWSTKQVEEMLTTPYVHNLTLGSNGYGHDPLYQVAAPPAWNKCSLEQALPDLKDYIIAVTRDGKVLPMTSPIILVTGDTIFLTIDPTGVEAIRSALTLK
jgi:trk system potassium uptake protein